MKKKYIEFEIKDKYVYLSLILLAYLISSLYIYTQNKAVGWDEAEYLSYAKHIATGKPYDIWDGRAMLYPIMLSIPFFFGGSQSALYMFEMCINVITIIMCYLVIEKYLNKNTALFTTLLFATSKLFLFYSFRFLTGIPSLMFLLIALYFFKDNKKISGIFIGLAIATRFTSALIIPSLIIYEYLNKKRKIKDYYWLFYVIIGYMPMFLYDGVKYGNVFHSPIRFFNHNSRAPKDVLFYIKSLPKIIGRFECCALIISIIYAIINYKTFKWLKYIFIYILSFVAPYSISGKIKSERFMIPILIPLFLLVASAFKSNRIKIILAILMIFGIYENINNAKHEIELHTNNYAFINELGKDISNLTNEDAIIITNCRPLTSYYSQRYVCDFPDSMQILSNMTKDEKHEYIFISNFERLPSYYSEFINNKNIIIVKEYVLNNETIGTLYKYNKSHQ